MKATHSFIKEDDCKAEENKKKENYQIMGGFSS